MAEMTSIKVSVPARDRLAVAARVRGISVRALLEELSRAAADAAFMEQACAAMNRLQEADAAAWADYVEEGAAWELGASERLEAGPR